MIMVKEWIKIMISIVYYFQKGDYEMPQIISIKDLKNMAYN